MYIRNVTRLFLSDFAILFGGPVRYSVNLTGTREFIKIANNQGSIILCTFPLRDFDLFLVFLSVSSGRNRNARRFKQPGAILIRIFQQDLCLNRPHSQRACTIEMCRWGETV